MLITLGSITWYAVVAAVSSLVSLLTVAKQSAQEDPLEDLTYRLRHPVRWRLSHPVRAIRRRISR